jgi:hypothetical protein
MRCSFSSKRDLPRKTHGKSQLGTTGGKTTRDSALLRIALSAQSEIHLGKRMASRNWALLEEKQLVMWPLCAI